MAKEKKPLVDIHIECPECKSELKVRVNRNRVNPAEAPEYEWTTNIETVKQGELFKTLDKPKNVKVSAKRKTA